MKIYRSKVVLKQLKKNLPKMLLLLYRAKPLIDETSIKTIKSYIHSHIF